MWNNIKGFIPYIKNTKIINQNEEDIYLAKEQSDIYVNHKCETLEQYEQKNKQQKRKDLYFRTRKIAI